MKKFSEFHLSKEVDFWDRRVPTSVLGTENQPFAADLANAYTEAPDSAETHDLDLAVRHRLGQIAVPGWVNSIVTQGAQRLFLRNDLEALREDAPEVAASYDAFGATPVRIDAFGEEPNESLLRLPAPYLRNHPHIFNWLMVADRETRGKYAVWNANRHTQLTQRFAKDSDMLRNDALQLTGSLIEVGLFEDAELRAMASVWKRFGAPQAMDTLGTAAVTAQAYASIKKPYHRALGNLYEDRTAMQGIGQLLRKRSFHTAISMLGFAKGGFLHGTTYSGSRPSVFLENITASYLTDIALNVQQVGVEGTDLAIGPSKGIFRFFNERAVVETVGVDPELLVAAARSPLGSAKRKMLKSDLSHKFDKAGVPFDQMDRQYNNQPTAFSRRIEAGRTAFRVGCPEPDALDEQGKKVDINDLWLNWFVDSK